MIPLATFRAGCRKRADFKGYGRRDAAIGERRQGRRVEPCPLKSALFREAEGQPVRREGNHRLPRIEAMSSEIYSETKFWPSGSHVVRDERVSVGWFTVVLRAIK